MTRDVLLRRPLADLPPVPPLPSGYSRRSWLPGDEERLPALLGEAFGPHRASYAALEGLWRRFPGLGPSGALFVESPEGEIAATLSTRVEGDRVWIHLVAVSGPHRRRGLATFAILSALDAHAGRRIDSAWVGTAAHRLAAIRLYLGLGFEVVDR